MDKRPQKTMDSRDMEKGRVTHVSPDLADGDFGKCNTGNLLATASERLALGRIQVRKRFDKRRCLAGACTRNHDEASRQGLVETGPQSKVGFSIGAPYPARHA